MIYTDDALTKPEDDELDRLKFAQQIARGIVESSSQNSEGLVIGITGPWGAGKSTLVNFMISEIEKIHKENETLFSPVILRFNPWIFTGQRELQFIFLSELYAEFRKFDSTLENASKKLQKFLEKLHLLKYVSHGVSEAVKDVTKFLESLNTESNLEELKKEVDQILIETQTKLYVTIDDIDRLTPSEVAEILQLVKLNGNFANTTFILSYDDEVVQSSMGRVFGEFGRNYLEKIVQIDYSVPFLSDDRKVDVLRNRLKTILTRKTLTENQGFVENLEGQSFFKLIRSIRDINRLLNAVKLRLPLMESEIHLPDFILIEALRIFCPKAYRFTYSHKSELFRFSKSNGRGKSGVEFLKEKNELKEFINSSDIEKDAKAILKELFVPQSNHELQADFSDRKHILSRRVTHNYYFNRYFSLELGERDVSEKEFIRFKKLKKVGRHKVLKEVISKERLVFFLTWLPLKVKFSDGELKQLFMDIYSYSDKVEFHDRRLFSDNHDFWLIAEFCSQYLNKVNVVEDRREVILGHLGEKRRQPKFFLLTLCVQILLAKEKFDDGKLYSNDRWYGVFTENDNTSFAREIEGHLKHNLKRHLRKLEKADSFEKYNIDEVNYILRKSQHFVEQKYFKVLSNIIDRIEHLIDLVTICISGKVMSSGTVSGFCLESDGLYPGMDIDDVYQKIKAIENLEEFDQNRSKTAKFYIKVYEDGFPADTYYNYESLEVVSRP